MVITTCFMWLLTQQMMVTKFVPQIFHLLNLTVTSDGDDDGDENLYHDGNDDLIMMVMMMIMIMEVCRDSSS